MSDNNEIDGITPVKAKLYKTAQLKETGEIVAVEAACFFAFNTVTNREEHVFNVYDRSILDPMPRILRGQFYQSALEHFVL